MAASSTYKGMIDIAALPLKANSQRRGFHLDATVLALLPTCFCVSTCTFLKLPYCLPDPEWWREGLTQLAAFIVALQLACGRTWCQPWLQLER